MECTVKGKEIDYLIGFALLKISLAMEYYWKGLDICGGVAPGMAAAFAIAMLIRSLVVENKWCATYQAIVSSPAKMNNLRNPNPNQTVAMPINDR